MPDLPWEDEEQGPPPEQGEKKWVEFDDPEKEYERLMGVVKKRGFKTGWAAYQFKEKFGHWPPDEIVERYRGNGIRCEVCNGKGFL